MVTSITNLKTDKRSSQLERNDERGAVSLLSIIFITAALILFFLGVQVSLILSEYYVSGDISEGGTSGGLASCVDQINGGCDNGKVQNVVYSTATSNHRQSAGVKSVSSSFTSSSTVFQGSIVNSHFAGVFGGSTHGVSPADRRQSLWVPYDPQSGHEDIGPDIVIPGCGATGSCESPTGNLRYAYRVFPFFNKS